MTAITFFAPSDFRRMPWKNGKGTTLELLREPLIDQHPASHNPKNAALARPESADSPVVERSAESARSPSAPCGTASNTLTKVPGEFLYRVSIASVVEDGSFSPFPGYDRIIMVLRGNGMLLSHDAGSPVRLDRLKPYSFAGDADTTVALIDGSAEDFNLMVRRGFASGRVLVKSGPNEVCLPSDATVVFVYVLSGSARLQDALRSWPIEVGHGCKIAGPIEEKLKLTVPDNATAILVVVRIF